MCDFYVAIPCFYVEDSYREDEIEIYMSTNLNFDMINPSCFKCGDNFYVFDDEIDKFHLNFKYLNNIVSDAVAYRKMHHNSIENVKKEVDMLDFQTDYLNNLTSEVECLKSLNNILLDKLNEEKERNYSVKLAAKQVIEDFDDYLSVLKR